jgi:hypothetical protein
MGASLVGDDVWEYQFSEYQEAPSYPKLTFFKFLSQGVTQQMIRQRDFGHFDEK